MTTRLVLWDIDHTLIDTAGVGREISADCFEAVTGRPMERQAKIDGVTEPVIFRETALLHGLETGRGEFEAYARCLSAAHVAREEELARRGSALAGAAQALDALAAVDGVVQSTVTGNVRGAAEVKLRAFGLAEHVDFTVGAFGEDHEVRADLVQLAAARAGRKYGVSFSGSDVVVIGDTPADVEAGLANGAFVIAVASGSTQAADLREAGAQEVLADLTETSALVALICGQRRA